MVICTCFDLRPKASIPIILLLFCDFRFFSNFSMARLRKEKGGKSQHAELRKQVIALGGTNEDYELVKNAKEPLSSAEGPIDVGLQFASFQPFFC